MKSVMKAVAIVMLMTMAVSIIGCKSSDVSSRRTHEYVDLGLPSGTLWATCNVGANKPEDFGKYFAWGETQQKKRFNESNYMYYKYDKEAERYYITKYCDYNPYMDGVHDDLFVLESGDDVAAVQWGEGWRIPTRSQWMELMDYTNNKWTTQNGVKGMLFTANNGNSIFLPACGLYGYEGFNGKDEVCGYWSCSLFTGPSVWSFYCQEGDCTTYTDFTREFGLTVRPVRSTK